MGGSAGEGMKVEVRVMEKEKVAKIFFQLFFLPQVLVHHTSREDIEISGTQVYVVCTECTSFIQQTVLLVIIVFLKDWRVFWMGGSCS